MKHEKQILLFVRYPEKGKVKSRLAAALNEDMTLHLYRAFIADVREMLTKSGYAIIVFYHPSARKHEIMNMFGGARDYVPQCGNNLGGRMKNAFIYCFSKMRMHNAILIGSDVPDLTDAILQEAWGALDTHDAVIGPALDGGYYLIGFTRRAFLPSVFDNIEWGTDTVYARTMQLFRAHHRTVQCLAPWRDIDTIDDLQDLQQRHKTTAFLHSHTLTYLREINLLD